MCPENLSALHERKIKNQKEKAIVSKTTIANAKDIILIFANKNYFNSINPIYFYPIRIKEHFSLKLR